MEKGAQTVEKVLCRGAQCAPVPTCHVRSFPEKALLRLVGGRTLFAPTSSAWQNWRFLTHKGSFLIAAKAIPHNSKCRYGERGAAAAKPKAQIILCVLSSILATQRPCRTPSRSEALRSATAACGGSWRGDPPEWCLSRRAGIVRCCLRFNRRSMNCLNAWLSLLVAHF